MLKNILCKIFFLLLLELISALQKCLSDLFLFTLVIVNVKVI